MFLPPKDNALSLVNPQVKNQEPIPESHEAGTLLDMCSASIKPAGLRDEPAAHVKESRHRPRFPFPSPLTFRLSMRTAEESSTEGPWPVQVPLGVLV